MYEQRPRSSVCRSERTPSEWHCRKKNTWASRHGANNAYPCKLTMAWEYDDQSMAVCDKDGKRSHQQYSELQRRPMNGKHTWKYLKIPMSLETILMHDIRVGQLTSIRKTVSQMATMEQGGNLPGQVDTTLTVGHNHAQSRNRTGKATTSCGLWPLVPNCQGYPD